MSDTEHPNPEAVKQRISMLQDAIAQALESHPPKVHEAFVGFVQYRDAVIEVFDELPEHQVDRYAKTAHRIASEIEAHKNLMDSPALAASQLYTWAAKAYHRLADLAPSGSVSAQIYDRQAGIEETRAALAVRNVEPYVHHSR